MKIAILAKSGVWGGAEVHAVGFAKSLIERDHCPVIVCLDQTTLALYQAHANGRVPLLKLAGNKPVERRSIFSWLLGLRALAADACLLVKGTLHTGSLGLDMAARIACRRYVTIEQVTPPPLPAMSSKRYLGGLIPGIGLWWYRQFLAGYSRSWAPHKVICVSDAVRKNLTTDYHFAAEKALIVHNGIDPSAFSPSAEQKLAVRQRWGVRRDTFVFGFVGRFASEKGLDLALMAFSELTSRFPYREMAFVLVGDGPQRPALEQLVREKGLHQKVVFPGFSDRPWEVYCGFDVFLLPSRREGLPLALLEAMASGCAPIATRVAGTPEVLSKPGIGWLIPGDDQPALLAALASAATADPKVIRDMGDAAREHVRCNFNAAVQFAKIAEILEQA